jgi:hypothetical protein
VINKVIHEGCQESGAWTTLVAVRKVVYMDLQGTGHTPTKSRGKLSSSTPRKDEPSAAVRYSWYKGGAKSRSR